MHTVNIQENEEAQRKIIREFTAKVRNKTFLTKEDFNEVFEFFRQIIELECKGYNIEAECDVKSNKLDLLRQSVANNMPESEWIGVDIAGCDYSDKSGKDIVFSLDPVFFCKKYFGKENLSDRLDGVVELLLTTYHEVDHSVKLMNLSRSYLSPEAIETSREIFLREALGDKFYDENYRIFSFERYADEYSYSTVLEMLTEEDILAIAEHNIGEKRAKRNEIAVAKLGKVKYMGDRHIKDSFLQKACSVEISRFPRFLYAFPIFEKQYKDNGTQKNIHELFSDMTEELRKIIHRHSVLDSQHKITPVLQGEYFDCQMFYYELILPHLSMASEQDYREIAEKYGVKSLQSFLSGMEKYFNLKAQEKLRYTEEYSGEEFESPDEIKRGLQRSINSIIRFRNGARFNPIAEELLRSGGFVRGTREVLPHDTETRRQMFANSLIGVYDAIESEDEYRKRAENEKMDIDEVVNALYYNRFENFLQNVEVDEPGEAKLGKVEAVRVAQILKIAKILSLETGQDYFGEFLKIPDVNRFMTIFEKDKSGYLKECMKSSQVRIKKVVYPLTEAEEGKYRGYILGNENTEDSQNIGKKIMMLNEEFGEDKPKRNRGVDRN